MSANRKLLAVVLALAAVGLALLVTLGPGSQDSEVAADWGVIAPDTARAQAQQFIQDWRSIELSAEEERTKVRALERIPAPCCDDNPISTCCCPCNLAKAVWGMSARLIAHEGAGADEVERQVRGWLEGINPDGWAGDACYEGRCDRPFHVDGCGGMDERMIF